MELDLLHPDMFEEQKQYKTKRLVQSPNSYFMDVKCVGCINVTTIFSHAQSVIKCQGCGEILCRPTGGKCRLEEGTGFRRK